MATQRKKYSAEFKARVAIEALKGHKTMNELVGMYGVHPTQITKWKNHLRSVWFRQASVKIDVADACPTCGFPMPSVWGECQVCRAKTMITNRPKLRSDPGL